MAICFRPAKVLAGMADPSKIDWKFFTTRLNAEKRYLYPAFFCALLSAGAQVGIAWMSGTIHKATFVNDVWQNRGMILICLGAVALIAFGAFSDSLHRYFLRAALEKMAQKLRVEIFSRFLVFSESAKSKMDSGAAINHLVTDVQLLSEARHFITEMVKEPLTLVALLGYLFYLNWRLCLICFFAIIPIALSISFLGRSAKRNQHKVQSQLGEVITSINESFQGMRTVHTFLLEKIILVDFKKLLDDLVGKLLKIARIEETVGPVVKIVSAIAGALVIYAGAYFVIAEKSITSEDLIRFLVAAGLMQSPLRNISQAGVQLQRISAGALRILSLFRIPLDTLSDDQQKLLDKDLNYATPDFPLPLTLKAISFCYPGQNQNALTSIDLTLEPGKKLALVGRSGSGKTTLSLLTLRLVDPTGGEVLLGGRPAPEWELGEYRAYFSYVSQEVYFFQGTLRENFKKVAPTATEAEMFQALEMAQLKTKITNFSNGLDVRLSEKAANFSGGERQRLAIARALLRKSPILILDEATSNLDSENEKLIQRALENLLQNRSAIIVAHRLSTVLDCDEVLVFENGVIIERGNPMDLRGKDSKFSTMWKIQQGEKQI